MVMAPSRASSNGSFLKSWCARRALRPPGPAARPRPGAAAAGGPLPGRPGGRSPGRPPRGRWRRPPEAPGETPPASCRPSPRPPPPLRQRAAASAVFVFGRVKNRGRGGSRGGRDLGERQRPRTRNVPRHPSRREFRPPVFTLSNTHYLAGGPRRSHGRAVRESPSESNSSGGAVAQNGMERFRAPHAFGLLSSRRCC